MSDIAVIIAAFDAAATIDRAVSTALMQPEVSEVVVVDDASRDGTAERAVQTAAGDRRFQLIRLPLNGGPSRARNIAVQQSSSAVVCVLDADDYLQAGRFSRLLNAKDDWDILADDLFIAEAATPDIIRGRLLGLEQYEAMDGATFIAGNLRQRGKPRRELGYLKPLMRRDFLTKIDLRYDESLRLGEDYALYAGALIGGARWLNVPACGYVAVRHAGSLSHRHGANDLAALAAADTDLIDKAQARAPKLVALLRKHRRQVEFERDYRRMLDAKAQGRWFAAATHALRSPATTTYIGKELLRAKLMRSGGPFKSA